MRDAGPSPIGNPDDPRHGKRSCYVRHKCRCVRCTAANLAYSEQLRERREPAQHGTASGYFNHGCRCDQCVEAGNADRRTRQARRQAATTDRATNAGKIWTGPELEVVARDDLTAREAALMLGRTFAAVQTQRRLMRIDPRKDGLAGKP